MQATAQMRRLLGDAVERLTESNLTSYTTALDFAFEEFRKVSCPMKVKFFYLLFKSIKAHDLHHVPCTPHG